MTIVQLYEQIKQGMIRAGRLFPNFVMTIGKTFTSRLRTSSFIEVHLLYGLISHCISVYASKSHLRQFLSMVNVNLLIRKGFEIVYEVVAQTPIKPTGKFNVCI